MEQIDIRKLSNIEKELLEDIQKLITNKKYKKLSIDDVAIVFNRIYSGYVILWLKENGKLKEQIKVQKG